MGLDPNKKSDHPAVQRMQSKARREKILRHLKLLLVLGVLVGGWVGWKRYQGKEATWGTLVEDVTGGTMEAIALLEDELKQDHTPTDEELVKLLRQKPAGGDGAVAGATAGGTAGGTTPEATAGGGSGTTSGGGGGSGGGTAGASGSSGGGGGVSTTATPELSPVEKAAQAKVKDANVSYDSCLKHYETFRSAPASDRKTRAREIEAALADIQKAAAGYASVLETLPDNPWLSERHRKSIEIMKECRSKVGHYK